MSFIERFLYSFRKLNHPIKRGDLVIDIGSGGNVHPRADLACDLYPESLERTQPIKIDRPFFWGNAENLPLKDKVIDFSILSHVLEHSFHPELIVAELERISYSGYIETPSAWQEFLIPYHFHTSRVSVIDNDIIIYMKKNWDGGELMNNEEMDQIKNDFKKIYDFILNKNPRLLISSLYWKDKINYRVLGESNFSKIHYSVEKNKQNAVLANDRLIWKELCKLFLYKALKPKNKVIIENLLCCPLCKGDLIFRNIKCYCKICNNNYGKRNGHWDFTNHRYN